ncbi:MAG: dTMP kinase [Candidatus Pacebacteria bacterium]|jgi:dTMP kinase|nr:dTMP kinase [Candidatus Paceibacterota bacterium]
MKDNPYPGRFIVIEGLDGSGQTTQVALLKKFLEEKGLQVVSTKEPTMDSEAGRKIREILDEKVKIEPIELQKLFTQDRKEHLEDLIVPALQDGKAVISDRYYFSTFAFGASDGLNLDELIRMNDGFLLPDLTIILKVPPRVCVERIEKRGEAKTLFEKENKLTRVWETYAVMPERFRDIYIVDGEQSIEEVFSEIKSLARLKLNIKEE